MNETYLATLLNTLLEKSALPSQLLGQYMKDRNEKFHNEHAEILAKLTLEDAKLEKLRDEAYKNLMLFDNNFKEHITNRKRTLRDARNTLEHFYNLKQQGKGTFHLAKAMSKWNIKINIKKTLNQEELEMQSGFSDEFIARYGEVRVEPHIVNGKANFLDIKEMIDPWVNSFYKYLELKGLIKQINDDVIKPIERKLVILEDKLEDAQTESIYQIIEKLSPVKPGQPANQVYSDEPLYHIFTGKQKPEDGEFPTTLAMDTYKTITNALSYASRVKTNGQENQPAVYNALSKLIPEILGDEDEAMRITSKWYDWKFDYFSIQQSFVSILHTRKNKQFISTSSSALNELANNIKPKQAALILTLVNQEAYAA
jgi:hypothetical protein